MSKDMGASLRDRAGHEPSPDGLGHTVAIPSAVRGFTVDCGRRAVTPVAIANVIDLLANIPERFRSVQLAETLLPGGGWYSQEATNRLMQRWRKMGLAVFDRGGRWRLTRGSWDTLQAQAIEARRAATGTGAVHESAVRQDAPQGGPDAS